LAIFWTKQNIAKIEIAKIKSTYQYDELLTDAQNTKIHEKNEVEAIPKILYFAFKPIKNFIRSLKNTFSENAIDERQTLNIANIVNSPNAPLAVAIAALGTFAAATAIDLLDNPTTTTTEAPTTTCRPQDCQLVDKNLVGSDLFNPALGSITSWEICGQICDITPTCKAWMWAGPNYSVIQGPGLPTTYECFLKSTIPSSITVIGLISGYKGCKSAEPICG